MTQRPLDEVGGGTAPKISFRLARPKHERVTELAEASGGTVSDLIRALIDRELAEQEEAELLAGGAIR